MSQKKKSPESQFPLAPLAAAVSAAIVNPVDALAQDESETILEEVIVTGTKMEANIQNVAFDIQALPESMLRDIGAQVTEDYARFVPAINWLNFNGGGENFLIFRGINTTTGGFTQTQSSSIYLDEIPITATDGTQPDIRMMDIERVEALAGPQGTLFGAAAQAGILRIITNKPDTEMFDANAEVMLRTGEDSDPSYQGTAMLNLPLVKDKFAIRIAAQFAEDGGYIDNVPGHTPDTWWGEHRDDADWGVYRQGWGTYRNDVTAEENWNSATSLAIRISARWDINEDWSATLTYHEGDTKSEGNNAYNPFVGDLETIGFVKNTSHSEWDMTGLVFEGDLGFAQFVSATSFYENQRTYAIDNTMYYKYYNTRSYCEDGGEFIPGYYWWWENTSTGRAIYIPVYCVTPATGDPIFGPTQIPDMAGVGEGPEWQERFTQEFRFVHQGETIDWLAGLYYEDSNDSWNSVWMKDPYRPYNESMSYAFTLDCASGGETAYWQCHGDPWGVMGPVDRSAEMLAALEVADHYWDSRDDTDWETKAIFGEVTWHATEKLDLTFGGRWFETKNTKTYIKYISGYTGPNERQTGGFIQYRWIGNDIPQTSKLDEFVPKFSASYQINDEMMIYGLYSEGYRVGGVNRANKNADWDRTLFGQVYEPDRLKNYELGYKSRWAQNSVQWNITYFYMDWEDFQHQVVDPSSGECIVPAEAPSCQPTGKLPWISIVGNVGDAHSTGITTSVDWVPADRWVFGANGLGLLTAGPFLLSRMARFSCADNTRTRVKHTPC
jgi:outer membrane receptor protein involved in Fe transport